MSDYEATLDELREAITYPQFNPALVPTKIDENTLHIRGGPWNGPVLTLTDHEEEDIISGLIDEIDGETHLDDVLSAFSHDEKGEVARALAELHEKEAIHDASDYEESGDYHHTALKPFERVGSFTDTDAIGTGTIGVVNVGHLARHIVPDVLKMGVGEVEFLEPAGQTDIAEEFEDDETFTVSDRSVEELVAASDFVVYASEQMNPEIEDLLNETALAEETPWMIVQRLGYDGLVGPTFFPGETACYECFEKRKLSNVVSMENYQAFVEACRDNDVDPATETLPEFNRMLGGFAAMDLRHLFNHGVGYTAGRVVATNSINLEMHADRVLKIPRCDVCGPAPTEKTSPFIRLEDFVRTNAPEKYEEW